MVAMFHALNMCFDNNNDVQGYRGDVRSPEYKDIMVERAKKALSGHLLCLSDRPIETVGIVTDTAIERLFAIDVNSFVDPIKERDVPQWFYEDDGGIHREVIGLDLEDQSAVYDWIKNEAPAFRENTHDDLAYCEVWGRAKAVKAVFVSKNISQSAHSRLDLEMGKHLAEELGVPLLVVDRYDRINEITIN